MLCVMLRLFLNTSLLALILFASGCITIRHEIAPIHATIDINLRVAKELDDIFGDLDLNDDTMNYNEPVTKEP